MSAKLRIDDKMFQGAMSAYLRTSKRELSDAINYKAYFIIKRAMRHMRKADKKRIRSFIRSAEGQEFIGKLFGRKRIRDESRAAATKRIISARIRSGGYLAAGWGKALAVFGAASKASRRMKGVSARAGLKGRSKGVAARPGLKPVADFSNPAGYRTRRHSGQKFSQEQAAQKFALPIFEASIRAEMRSMKAYMDKKMKAAAKRSKL